LGWKGPFKDLSLAQVAQSSWSYSCLLGTYPQCIVHI